MRTSSLLASSIALSLTLLSAARATSPLDTTQPSTAINFSLESQGIFADLGMIHMFAGTFPLGLATNGALLPINQNTALFSRLGTTFGGNGVTTFALPNLNGRTMIGAGQGPGLSPYNNGDPTGTTQVTLALPQMPASVGGGGQAFTNLQPSLALNYVMALAGEFPGQGGGTDSLPMLGQVFPTAGDMNILTNNTSYVLCDGRLLPINQNQALFAVLGTTYGGNGTTTFALPDLRGRAVVGAGTGPGITSRTTGQTFGTEATTLLPQNLPAPYGPDASFSNMQPSAVLHYIVALNGIFPNRDGNGFGNNDPFLGEVTLFAGISAPAGWAFCDGQIMAINQNTALFALLGTTYGGNGVTTFALPNLDGSIAVGEDANLWPAGLQTGTETLTLSPSQIPPVPEPASLSFLTLGLLGLLRRPRK